VTSLARIFAESPNADAAHIDRGILAWLAEVDPEGDPAFHGRVVRAVADAAIRYDKKLGLIPAQDGAQAALAWIAEHPEKLRSWSGADGLMVKTLRNKISTAVSTEHGDHKVTVDGLSSRPRIYFEDETPLSELAAADALAADDDKPKSFEDAVHSRLGPRAHVPSAEDAYFAKLDGVTSETRIGASAPVPYEIKLGREYVDGHDPVPLSEEARLELPPMSRVLYRAQRVALGVLSPKDCRLLKDHQVLKYDYGTHVALKTLAARVGSTEGALDRRLRRLRKKVRDFFATKFPELSGSAPIGQVPQMEGYDVVPDAHETKGHDHAGIDHRHRATGTPHRHMPTRGDAGHLHRPVVPFPDRGPGSALHRPGGSTVRSEAAHGPGDRRGSGARSAFPGD
jgi:hypothetical protein